MSAHVALILVAMTSVTAAPVGPSVRQFNELRTAIGEKCPAIRKLACAVMGDPSEFKCTYDEHFPRRQWTPSTALVAKNGTGWTWLDGGPRCSPLPQR